MPIKSLDSQSAKENWHELLDIVSSGLSDTVITRHDKPAIAMIRYEDFAALQDELRHLREGRTELYQVMLASEQVLRREWDAPEEDAAWVDL